MEWLFTGSLIGLAIAAALAVRVLRKLERACRRIESDQHPDRGLLRWYAQGFAFPERLSSWLARIGAVLTLAALAAPVTHWLAAGTLALTVLGVYCQLQARQRSREHQWVLCRIPATTPPPHPRRHVR